MSELSLKSTVKVAGGTLSFYKHHSETCNAEMNFSIFLPPASSDGPPPLLYWLSGLTCTEENFMVKAGAQRAAARLGIAIVAPDTSPRGLDLPGEHDDWDFGSGAGFYVNATQEPWSAHYRTYDYVTKELPGIVEKHFEVDSSRCAISGHSMGGHGALMIALRNPGRFRSVSAFAPICAPTQCPWGEKAFSNYLGDNREEWAAYDSCKLLSEAETVPPILVDQGKDDSFLANQLHPELLMEAAAENKSSVTLRMQPGYDHSYYFIASFIEDHLAHHHKYLRNA